MSANDLMLEICQEVQIKAPLEKAFRSMLRTLAEGNTMQDGKTLSLELEAWPGGRWFRNTGEGQGHLWGFVQVIKPPTLLEITGPLFMSYPAANHVQFRLTPEGEITKLTMKHRALGLVEAEHRSAMVKGWEYMINNVRKAAEE